MTKKIKFYLPTVVLFFNLQAQASLIDFSVQVNDQGKSVTHAFVSDDDSRTLPCDPTKPNKLYGFCFGDGEGAPPDGRVLTGNLMPAQNVEELSPSEVTCIENVTVPTNRNCYADGGDEIAYALCKSEVTLSMIDGSKKAYSWYIKGKGFESDEKTRPSFYATLGFAELYWTHKVPKEAKANAKELATQKIQALLSTATEPGAEFPLCHP